MVNSGIYIITNIENGKAYIGSTNNFENRWGEHKRILRKDDHYNPYLQYAWNKYGEEAFEFGVLEYLEDVDKLVKAEQFWMDVYREEGRELYNIALTADCPMRGRKQTKKSNHRRSESLMGHKVSEETKHKISESKKGTKHTEEAKRKIGIATKGKKRSKETRRRQSDAQRGKKRSEETRSRMSESKRGNKNALGHRVSEEARHKMSEARKGKSSGMLGKKHSKETRHKMSVSAKARWDRIKEK